MLIKMSNKAKQIHNNYCNYMVEKATNNTLKYRNEEVKKIGIKSNGMTKNELILALAE